MAPYIKLFQKHQNLHLYALGEEKKNLSQINILKYPPPQKKDKTLIRSPQIETKTPVFHHSQRKNNQKQKGSSVSYGTILDSVVRTKMSASSIKHKLLNPIQSQFTKWTIFTTMKLRLT